ncbi:hypothetical protein AVEN_133706-1 [Araneus ventricosus]|uniref:Ig-like domain-containing protein n=1 Tax=Araneus ventricosus TaxID=182803 RepID=A0A4Y2B8E0_ARAVE|nr:hypothetical protein AVEN_133706-1 [Araneus ventricosus]
MGVADEDIAPTFTKKPTLREEDDGNKLVFECELHSNPKASFQWYRGDVALHDDQRTKGTSKEIGPNKYKITLELNDVFETDAGMYKVTAKNKYGEVSASINLNFSPADQPHDYNISCEQQSEYKHNCRIWVSENPHAVQEVERNSPKINVWCALSHDAVIGPFVFAETSVTANTYLDMLQIYTIPQIQHLQPTVIFQQDAGARMFEHFVGTGLPAGYPQGY